MVESRANRAMVPLQKSHWVGLASNRSSKYWSRVQFKVSPRKAARSTARASQNRVREFLKPVAVKSKPAVSFSRCVGLLIQRQTRAGWRQSEGEECVLEIEAGEPACLSG